MVRLSGQGCSAASLPPPPLPRARRRLRHSRRRFRRHPGPQALPRQRKPTSIPTTTTLDTSGSPSTPPPRTPLSPPWAPPRPGSSTRCRGRPRASRSGAPRAAEEIMPQRRRHTQHTPTRPASRWSSTARRWPRGPRASGTCSGARSVAGEGEEAGATLASRGRAAAAAAAARRF